MESLRYKAHTCFEMSARLVSMAFATEEAEDDYRKRIATTFHEFIMEFVEQLSPAEKDKYGTFFSKLALCFKHPLELVEPRAQSIRALYTYHKFPAFEVLLKHKQLIVRDLMHTNGIDEAKFTLEF